MNSYSTLVNDVTVTLSFVSTSANSEIPFVIFSYMEYYYNPSQKE